MKRFKKIYKLKREVKTVLLFMLLLVINLLIYTLVCTNDNINVNIKIFGWFVLFANFGIFEIIDQLINDK